MSTKPGGSDHLFLFTYANYLLWEMAFFLIFSVYLFIYLKQSKQKQVEATTFIYLCKSLVVRDGFHCNIKYLFIYSKRCQQNQVEATTCFYLLMQITCCEKWLSF